MSVRFVQMHSYSSPKVTEQKNQEWVEYGEDNNYFQYLIDLYHSSPTNNAAVKGIADLIFGNGLEVVSADKELEGYVHLKKLFQDDCVKKIAMDLKMLGQASFQLIKNKKRDKYVQAEHFPIQTLRPEKANEEGEIEAYYYHPKWEDFQKGDEPERIPTFGYDDGADICIYVIKPYSTGNFYFNPVDYQGGLQYAELEAEIANYHLNNIKNSLMPTMIVNFNNGIPDERKQNQIESKLKSKFGGSSNTGKFILAFNDSADTAATIEPIQLSDAHNQYQFLSTECMTKIMVAHRVTSPMLLGIKDNTGLGNNADELKTASILFDNSVIKPFQNTLISAINDVLHANGYSLDIYFKTLQPLEFTDLSGKMVDAETTEKETGVQQLNSDKPKMSELQEKMFIEALEEYGEIIDEDEWELSDEEVIYDTELEDHKYKFFKRFANPEDKSQDDAGVYKIRYRYAPLSAQDNSRVFCKNMVANAKSGVVYRREDIESMEGKVNVEFSAKGESSYSIWQFKGGANCHHYWTRLTYVRKRQKGKFLPKSDTPKLENDKRISEAQAKRDGANMNFDPKGWNDAQVRPIDMPDGGKLN